MPKPNDPLNPDNAPNPPSTPARKKVKDAESNLPPGADLEDRFNEFWRQNMGSIFVAIIIGAVIVIGVQTWRYIQHRAEVHTQESFAAATTPEQLQAFAQAHPKHTLGGVAWMKLANGAYEKGDYKTAAEDFDKAGEQLRGTPLGGRTAIGHAMAVLLGGDTAGGKDALKSILNNPGYSNSVRTEAGHLLAMQLWEEKDWKTLKEVVDTVLSFDPTLPYRAMTEQMAERIPELQELENKGPAADASNAAEPAPPPAPTAAK